MLLSEVTTIWEERLQWLENLARFLRHELTAVGTSVNMAQGLASTDDSIGVDLDAKGTMWTLPVVFNYLGISNDKHTLEVELGFTYIEIGGDLDAENIDILNVTGGAAFGNFVLGYRLQPTDGGFQFRTGYSPLYGHGIVQHWAYLSLGGAF